jgi:septal ring-binding cell division protein DamX
MITFRLHRNGVVLLALGGLLLGLLLFMAGCLVGERRGVPGVKLPGVQAPGVQAPAVQASAATGLSLPAPALSLPAPPALPAAPALPGTPAPAAPQEVLTLRLGAFATLEEAKAFGQELAARGLQPVVASLPARGDVVLHTVCAGRYGDRSAAAAAASDLAQRQGLAAAVVEERAP